MLSDPLNSNENLRRTSENEAMDGQGNRYRLEHKHQFEEPPMLVTFGLVFLLILFLGGDGEIESDSPEPDAPNPTLQQAL